MESIIRHVAAFGLFAVLIAPFPIMAFAVGWWRNRHPFKPPAPKVFVDRPNTWWGDVWEWVESEARWYASADYLWSLPYILYALFCLFGAYVLRVDILWIMGVQPPADPPHFPSHLR